MEISYTEGSRQIPSLIVTPHSALNSMEEGFEERYSFNQINNIITEHLSSLKKTLQRPIS